MRTAFVYNIVKRWIFVLATVVLILMNFLSNAIPFGGNTNAMISAKYPTLITPAGYAFSIWGLIYTTIIVFTIFQLLRGKQKRFYNLIWPYYLVNVVANVCWLIAFQNEWFYLSVALILVLLGSFIGMFRFFYRLRRALGTTHRFFFQVPFSLYFGWVSLATVVNIAVLLVASDATFLLESDQMWAVVMIGVSGFLAIAILFTKKDFIYCFPIIWGLIAIGVKQSEIDVIASTAYTVALIVALAVAFEFLRDRIQIARYGKSKTQLKGS
jgi:hypothetical protein